MKIWQIDDAIEKLVDPETGELKDYEAFASLQMERNRKIEGMALWVKNLTAEANAIKAEEDGLKERRKALEKKAEGIRGYLTRITGGQAFHSAKAQIGFRTSKTLEVFNPSATVKWLEENGFDDYVKYSEPEVVKDGVKKLLKTVEHIPGCVLEEHKNISIK